MPQRSILITGCSTGIGYDAAHHLHSSGWKVFAACRMEKDVERLAGEGLTSLRLDYERPETISSAVDRVLAETDGCLDALFNNGAYAIPGPIEDLSRSAIDAIFQANFVGWHDLTVQLIPAMRKQGHGRIINCSSVLGFVSTPFRGAYCATKFALEAWSDALRMEMSEAGIKVILIEPGPIETKFRENAVRAFYKWVDWERSARVEEYETDLLTKLNDGSSNSRFQLPASAVTAKLVRALDDQNPKPRYFVTVPTYGANLLRRALPTVMLDKILARN